MVSIKIGRRLGILNFLLSIMLLGALSGDASAASAPANLANDAVTKLLGADVMNAAVKEGRVVWYAGENTGEFFQAGGKEAFEKRFGIKIELDVLDGKSERVGVAKDYRSTLEPRQQWRFRALVLDNRAASAQVASIEEDQ